MRYSWQILLGIFLVSLPSTLCAGSDIIRFEVPDHGKFYNAISPEFVDQCVAAYGENKRPSIRSENHCMNNLDRIQRKEMCYVIGGPCLIDKSGNDFGYAIPPFKIASPWQLARGRPSCSVAGVNITWLPADRVSDAQTTIASWKRLADDQAKFDCDDNYCLGLVRTILGDPHGSRLAVCEFLRIDGVVGAPQRCLLLNPEHDGSTYVPTISGFTTIQCYIGERDFTVSVMAGPDTSKQIVESFNRTLQGPPWLYTTRLENQSLLATARDRVSPVLSPWREKVTVRVDFRMGRGVEFDVATTIYVNRQNTPTDSDWHLPDQTQNQRYVSELLEALKGGLADSCVRLRWADSYNGWCE